MCEVVVVGGDTEKTWPHFHFLKRKSPSTSIAIVLPVVPTYIGRRFPGVSGRGVEADHSPIRAEVKNAWIDTSSYRSA
jgi:hypothetical protein